MTNSSMIPGIVDSIVLDKIMPLLPWHTRPLLMALSGPWSNALYAIGVQGREGLYRPHAERTARETRLKQPLKCRIAVEYVRTNRKSESGYMVKLFDGQWRNVAPIIGRGPNTHTGSSSGYVLGVVDGRLYFGERPPDGNPGVQRIIALDVGSGSWQWNEVCEGENYNDILLYICRSNRVAGNLFVYRRCRRWRHLQPHIRDSYLHITEIPRWEETSYRAPEEHFVRTIYSPRPIFLHVGNRLYFFGSVPYTENVWFLDLNTSAWNKSKVEAHVGGDLNVEKNVLLVAYNETQFHILRYDLTNKRWIIAGRMLAPADPLLKWTWCVEYDDLGEKQLWIYIRSHREGEGFRLCKWQVVQTLREGEGRLMGNVWDDNVLRDGEVECELVNRTLLEPLEPLQSPRSHGLHRSDSTNFEPTQIPNFEPTQIRSLHGFHRSDSTNFEDIPRVNVPNYSVCFRRPEVS